jgi:hypothetical protein
MRRARDRRRRVHRAATSSATCCEATDDVQVTNLDALTYAGNLASLRDVEDDPGTASSGATSATGGGRP